MHDTVRLADALVYLQACDEARAWLAARPPVADVREHWDACPRADWLLWLAGRAGVDQRLLVLAACDCARGVLHLVPRGEDRPRYAIEAAERWARGEATIEEVCAARDGAYAAAAAARRGGADAAADAADAAAAAAAARAGGAPIATSAPTDGRRGGAASAVSGGAIVSTKDLIAKIRAGRVRASSIMQTELITLVDAAQTARVYLCGQCGAELDRTRAHACGGAPDHEAFIRAERDEARDQHLVHAGEDRPRLAIEAAEMWARGEATIEDVRIAATATAADAAAAAAGAAYYSAASAAHAAHAARAAYSAAPAASSAADADAVRARIRWADVDRGIYQRCLR